MGEVQPGAVRLDVERKRIMDAIRMATHYAESALARMIAPHYARADGEAHSLLLGIYSRSVTNGSKAAASTSASSPCRHLPGTGCAL